MFLSVIFRCADANQVDIFGSRRKYLKKPLLSQGMTAAFVNGIPHNGQRGGIYGPGSSRKREWPITPVRHAPYMHRLSNADRLPAAGLRL